MRVSKDREIDLARLALGFKSGYPNDNQTRRRLMTQKISKVNWRDRIRRTYILSALYGVGLFEAYYLPRYGIQWLLGGILATVLLASFWIRSRWN